MTIRGPKQDLDAFIKAVTLPENDGAKTSNGEDAGGFDFARVFPTPTELADTTAGFYTAEPNENWAKRLADGEMTQEWYDELVRNNAEGYAKNQANLAKYGYKDWYDWNCANWGTKWSPRVESLELSEYPDGSAYIQAHYETAWSPASGLIAKISTEFPNLIFEVTFDEESMAYVGCEIFFQGRVFGTDFDPHQIENYPENLQGEASKLLKKLEDSSDSDEYFDLHQDLLDLQGQLKDEAERIATDDFLREFPGAYAEV